MSLSGTVMEIWCLKDMYTDTNTDTHMETQNDLAKIIIFNKNIPVTTTQSIFHLTQCLFCLV